MSKPKERHCPKCKKVLTRKWPRKMVFECQEHGLYRAVVKRQARKFNPNDSSTWRAKCGDCGDNDMEYYNYKYHCMKCGNTLYV